MICSTFPAPPATVRGGGGVAKQTRWVSFQGAYGAPDAAGGLRRAGIAVVKEVGR
jgi:hypothetical protein